ncbi:MAG TPA: hypothetical protein PK156_41685 [Polyangium sp.]|nr:hypothetical protein [Polyangium sp.]
MCRRNLGAAREFLYTPRRALADELPRITAERLQGCVNDFREQLPDGSWAFSPEVLVYPNGRIARVNAGGVPETAPDLAACTRDALGDMAIPSGVFNMRRKQSFASTTTQTSEQRSLMGNPALVVIVVVGLGEIAIEAGAATILFAVTVKVVDKAVDDVEEALKRRPPITDDDQECVDGYERCTNSGGGMSIGTIGTRASAKIA